MNTHTLTVVIIDGGLLLFFLYALYYISRLGKRLAGISVVEKSREATVAVKVSEYEPERIMEKTKDIAEPQSGESLDEPRSVSLAEDLEKDSLDSMDEDKENMSEPLILESDSREGTDVIEIEGIGEVYARKLYDVGVYTVQELLERGATRDGRDEIASQSEISSKLVLEWVNHADLFRVDGIGGQYSDLLEETGVDTVPELARRNPENLLEKMREVNQEKNLVNRLPSLNSVENWVAQAKLLPRKIEY